jgi:predicted DNA-binding transcriptional regulator AlpA
MTTATEKRKFIIDEVLTTPEAMEFLGISRSRISSLIKGGKLLPVKKSGAISLFLKSDLEQKRNELISLRAKYRPYEN